MIDYSFHPEAEAEFAQAVQFYENHARGLGTFFISEIERTLFIVRRFPKAGMPDADAAGCRKVVVARFPYALVYRHSENQVLVVAVAHQRRRPAYWRQRR